MLVQLVLGVEFFSAVVGGADEDQTSRHEFFGVNLLPLQDVGQVGLRVLASCGKHWSRRGGSNKLELLGDPAWDYMERHATKLAVHRQPGDHDLR